MNSFEMVGEFHKAFGSPIADSDEWKTPDEKTMELRANLILEEYEELADALLEKNDVEIVDALCDLEYVIQGAAHTYGLDFSLSDDSKYEIAKLASFVFGEYLKTFIKSSEKNDMIGLVYSLIGMQAIVTYIGKSLYGNKYDECFNEVHRSNMSKLGEDGKPIYREDGKIMKGPNFSKPNLGKILDS